MFRHSLRLLASGYYTPDWERTISYKERLQKIFKRRWNHHLRRDAETTSWDHQPGPSAWDHQPGPSTWGHQPGPSTWDHQPGPSTQTTRQPSPILTVYPETLDTHSTRNRFNRVRGSSSANSDINDHRDLTHNRGCTRVGFLALVFFLFLGLAHLTLPPPFTPIRQQIQRLQMKLEQLRKERNIYFPVADRLPNFALESLGAKVVSHSGPYISGDPYIRCFGIPVKMRPVTQPTVTLQGRTQLVPGQCWAFPGKKGHLTISLSHQAIITHVTVGHILKVTSPTGCITSAPQRFSVYGMKSKDGEETRLGSFVYDQGGDPIQTFRVHGHKQSAFSFIRLQVESNWGNPDYTCLYSVRVHGTMAKTGGCQEVLTPELLDSNSLTTSSFYFNNYL